eukprot:4892395-Alexandrium_andersonii.AAC.1
MDRLQKAKANGELPRRFWEKAKAAGEGPPCMPIALYLDGIQTARHETSVGFYCYNMLTGNRQLCALLRKSEICQCGCRGWCSIYPIMLFLSWSVAAMKAGIFPTSRHDGSDFRTESDAARRGLAG